MIGVDFGSTYVDVVVMEQGQLRRTYSELEKNYTPQFLKNIIDIEILWKKEKAGRGNVAVTGAKSDKFDVFIIEKKNPHILEIQKHLSVKKVLEIDAIANGSKFLTKMNKFAVLNVGTGTPFVFVDGDDFEHIAGTGIGGGTLEGLSRLLLNGPVSNLEALAREGDEKLDLMVGDLILNPIGNLTEKTTASNFGKVSTAKEILKADVAKSLLKMVGETLGVMGALAARSKHCREVVFTGRVMEENSLIRKYAKEAAELFGATAHFPENAKYCTAIGAVLAANKEHK